MEKKINEESNKPTLSNPVTDQSKDFESNFDGTMKKTAPDVNINEFNGLLTEKEQSLKKKIWNLAKMESLVHADPKLSAVYNDMAENGEEKYGYHYNETIQNIIFNDYVLNSPKYLQKYKMAVPKKKKRRDKSGINQLKKSGEETMNKKADEKQSVDETDVEQTEVIFLIHPNHPEVFAYFPKEKYDVAGKYMSGYAHVGQHTAVAPAYAKESSPATPEEYQELQSELTQLGYNLNVLNGVNETTSAGGGATGSGGSADYTYSTPSAWGDGDLTKGKKSSIMRKPIWQGGSIIGESNYLTETDGFENFVKSLSENVLPTELLEDESDPHSLAYDQKTKTNVVDMDAKASRQEKIDIVSNYLENNKKSPLDLHRMPNSYIDVYYRQVMKATDNTLSEAAKSKAQQRFMGMVHAYQKGELDSDKVTDSVKKAADSMKNKDAKDFASTKHKNKKGKELPEKVTEDMDNIKETEASMIGGESPTIANKPDPVGLSLGNGNVPSGAQETGGLQEEDEKDLFEQLNEELEAFSIHHERLKKIVEDKKTPSMVQGDRLRSENPKNFKKDLQHSGTKDIINVEKEIMWKDQQTDIGKDPQKLGADIEKTELKNTEDSLKNVGDSTNDNGDEIPKRNMTDDEQSEVDMMRNGQHSLVYDGKPSERFEERMKADMGDKVYKQRQDQLEFKGKAPMYNKEEQPIEDSKSKKVQYNKEQEGWNDDSGINESFITGRYYDMLNKTKLIEFTLSEVKMLKTPTGTARQSGLAELSFDGFGNKYVNKTENYKVSINETVANAIDSYKFYTDGTVVFAMQNPVQKLTEGKENEENPQVNEGMNKMKHLLGYDPKSFTNTKNIKKNRGF